MYDPDPTIVAKDPLLQPLTIKHVLFRNRIMSTSHAAASRGDGMPKERLPALPRGEGEGRHRPVDVRRLLEGGPRFAEDLPPARRRQRRHHPAPAAVQLSHPRARRRHHVPDHASRPARDPYAGDWLPTIAPSPIRETLHRSIPKEMDEHDIDRVIKDYAAAALRCKEGGLDGIETVTGGHLIGQFLSPVTNRRTDALRRLAGEPLPVRSHGARGHPQGGRRRLPRRHPLRGRRGSRRRASASRSACASPCS